jgi:hypothetical protein
MGVSPSDWLDATRGENPAIFWPGIRRSVSALLAAFVPTPAAAQTAEPIKIGYSMALTGGLAPNGRSALLAQKIWEEDTNAKGGLLGRPVLSPHSARPITASGASFTPAFGRSALPPERVGSVTHLYGPAVRCKRFRRLG